MKDEVAEIGAQLEREMKRERDVFGSDVRAYAFAAKKQVGLRRDAARELQERETDRLRRGVKRSMKSDVDPAVIAEAKTTFETTEGRKVTALSAIQQRLAKQKVGQKAAKGLKEVRIAGFLLRGRRGRELVGACPTFGRSLLGYIELHAHSRLCMA